MSRSRVPRGAHRQACLLAVGSICITGLMACSNPGGAAQTTRPDASGIVWLCRPGSVPDPCTASLKTTVVEPSGARHVVDYRPAKNPPIDCFYIYPNITLQTPPTPILRLILKKRPSPS